MTDVRTVPPGAGPRTKTDYAVNALRDMVRRGELQPGTRINVGELARQLAISPTPVREAVRLLQAEGMLVYSPHRGARVADIPTTELEDTYRIRMALEGLATELAAERLTEAELSDLRNVHERFAEAVAAGRREIMPALNDEFHFIIYRGARSSRLLHLILSVWRGAPSDTFSVIPERDVLTLRAHEPILRAIEVSDPRTAGARMVEHIARSIEVIRSWAIRDQGDTRDEG